MYDRYGGCGVRGASAQAWVRTEASVHAAMRAANAQDTSHSGSRHAIYSPGQLFADLYPAIPVALKVCNM